MPILDITDKLDGPEEWIDPATGYRCIVLIGPLGALCGYVSIPNTHPLYEKKYSFKVPFTKEMEDRQVNMEKLNPIALLCQYENFREVGLSLDVAFMVHGGITFSNKPSAINLADNGSEWLFGFDCAHAGDRTNYSIFDDDVYRNFDYVKKECEALAIQLHDFANADKG